MYIIYQLYLKFKAKIEILSDITDKNVKSWNSVSYN